MNGVTVKWVLELSQTNTGTNTLLINDNEVISTNGMNMPNAQIFADIFQQDRIDFELQEPVFYERIQIGATANPTAESLEMFIDNFSVSIY